MPVDNGKTTRSPRFAPDRWSPLVLLVILLAYIGGMSFLYPRQGDDFAFSWIVRDLGAWSYIRTAYCNWTLRLGEVFNLILLYGGKSAFNILAPFFQLALALAMFRFAFRRPVNWKNSTDLAALTLLLALNSVWIARPRDTVFWMAGTSVYSFGLAVWFGFWGWARSGHSGENRWRDLLGFGWGAAAAMTVENCALCGFLVGGWVVVENFRRHRKLPGYIRWALGGYLLGLIVFFTQPGRWQRLQQTKVAQTLPEHLFLAGEVGLFHAVAAVVAGALLVIVGAELWRQNRAGFRQELPQVAELIFWSLVADGIFVVSGVAPAMRAYLFAAALIGMAAVRGFAALAGSGNGGKFSARLLWSAVAAATVIRLGIALPVFCQIDHDRQAREKIIRQAPPEVEVTVPEYSAVRQNFFQYIWIEDITPDPDDPFNVNCAKFYRVKKIRTAGRAPIPLYWKKR